MSEGSHRLEHLLWRYLDGECTPEERELVEGLAREDRQVRTALASCRRLDLLVGEALHGAVGRSAYRAAARTWRARVGRGVAVAVAACLAALAWLYPGTGGRDADTARAAQGSWFMTPAPQLDAAAPLPSAYVRPELRLRGTARDWIVIPADEPGRYLVIEVERVQTHVIAVHRDY